MTTLIKNGLVYNGEGNTPLRIDILINGDKIIRLGSFSGKKFDKIIDATNAIVFPGFIDINSVSDHYLTIFSDSSQENYIKQGVTAIIGGNCGASLAPIAGNLDSIRKWGDPSKININWHSFNELSNILKKQKIGVNFGSLIGYSTVRRSIIGEKLRDLTDREMESLKKIISQSFNEGAYGVSLGWDFIHSKQIPYLEIKEIARLTASADKIFATHLKDSFENLVNGIKEIINLAKDTDVNMEINDFRPLQSASKDYLKAKLLLEENTANSHIDFDVSLYSSKPMPIYLFLPSWLQNGGFEIMLTHLNDKHFNKRIFTHFKNFNLKNIIIGNMPDSLKFLSGKTLESFAANSLLTLPETLLALMKICGLRGTIFYKNIDEKLLEDFIMSPKTIIASHWASFSGKEKADIYKEGVFKKFILWAKEQKDVPLEKNIMKITSLPAKKYHLKERGYIRENYFADLSIWRDWEVNTVLVNGNIALENEKLTNQNYGVVI